MSRTDQEIVDQTYTLAHEILHAYGFKVPATYSFHEAQDPRSCFAWNLACKAQEILTHTDVQDALDNLEEDELAHEVKAATVFYFELDTVIYTAYSTGLTNHPFYSLNPIQEGDQSAMLLEMNQAANETKPVKQVPIGPTLAALEANKLQPN